MGERLQGPLKGAPMSMKLMAYGPALLLVVMGLIMSFVSLFINGETRLKLTEVEAVSVCIVATGENISFTEEEVNEFEELFDNKAIYPLSEKDAPFNNYVVIMTVKDETLGDIKFYVSKDRMTLYLGETGYKATPLVDQWKGLNAIYQAHNIAL